MDIDLLKTFMEVQRTRHFKRAAENLHLTQSAVSARIRLLEDTIGAALFSRERNNIQLTPAGQRLLPYADGIVHAWNRARQQVALQEDNRASLSVSAVPSLSDAVLEPWLERVYGELPELALHVELQGAERQLRGLLDGTIDIGLSFETPQVASVNVVPLTRVRLVLVASTPGVGLRQALSERYVLVDWGGGFASAHARHFPDMPPPAARVSLGRTASRLIRGFGGAAYLAQSTCRAELERGELHPVSGAPVLEREVFALYRIEAQRRPDIERALALTADHAGAGELRTRSGGAVP